MLSCFVICSFKPLTLLFYGGYNQPISFLVQFSEDSSVWLQFLDFAGSQVPLSDLSFNLVIKFFCVMQCLGKCHFLPGGGGS